MAVFLVDELALASIMLCISFMYSSALLIDPLALLQFLSAAGDFVVAAECAVRGVKYS